MKHHHRHGPEMSFATLCAGTEPKIYDSCCILQSAILRIFGKAHGQDDGAELRDTELLQKTLKIINTAYPSDIPMLHIKPFRQTPGFCGPACLKMILEYYGVSKTEQELAELSGANPQLGVQAEGLKLAGEKLGFAVHVHDSADFNLIQRYLEQNIPVLVQWWLNDDGHWSVVVDLNQENIYLQDPNIGMVRALRRETFLRNWFDFLPTVPEKENLILRRLVAITPIHAENL